jgi:hypothetical protein
MEDEPGHVRITDEGDAPARSAFAKEHPLISYLFADMVRGFYLVGCLGLDVFAPLQLRQSLPGLDPIVLPGAAALLVALAFAEWKLYRRLWPGPAGTPVLEERSEAAQDPLPPPRTR